MRVGTTNFCGSRLLQVREARGITQTALSEKINRDTSTISRWEKGTQFPEPEMLHEVSRIFDMPISYFLSEDVNTGDTAIFFRSMASATQTIRKSTKSKLKWFEEISFKLQEWLDFPELNIIKKDIKDFREIDNDLIENAALECRKIWQLGLGPVSDLLLSMENNGILVSSIYMGSSTMDGVSKWSSLDNRPYVMIASDKNSCVRSRFDAAHELGHIILHSNINEKNLKDTASFKEIEMQAHQFASAFLMPADSFGSEISSPSLSNFAALKPRWKTSIASMIVRCNSLGIISDTYQTQMWKYYSSRGWRKGEPLDDILEIETPRVMERSIKLLLDEGIMPLSRLLNELHIGIKDIEEICNLPNGYLHSKSESVVLFPKSIF